MSLATRCPWCDTIFRLTTAQASARAGMVRCGVCNHSFNALDGLISERDLGVGRLHTENSPSPHDDHPAPVAPRTHHAPAAEAQAQAHGGSSGEPRNEPHLSADWPQAAPSLGQSDLRAPLDPLEMAPDERIELHALDDEPVDSDSTTPSFMKEEVRSEPMSGSAKALWTTLCMIAFLFLLGQAAYAFRNEIAARMPDARPILIDACIALRCRIQPVTDISAITIESSELQPIPGTKDAFYFSTLLRNHSSAPLGYPDIELILTDTADATLIRRVFTPSEYLPANLRALEGDGLAANSELSVRIAFATRGTRPVGYHAGVFYP